MKKPIIVMMWGSCLDSTFTNHSMMLSKSYAAAITAAGGIPVMPLVQEQIPELLELGDGLLLPGGMSFVPRAALSQALKAERFSRQSQFESELYQAFRKAGKPVLGICAGFQKISCEEGGNLVLDFRHEKGIEHHLGSTHGAVCSENSKMRRFFGEKTRVNSYHGYRLNKIGSGLRVTMRSDDGVPEAVEHETLPIIATQWHPERARGDFPNPPEGPSSESLFSWFMEACRNSKLG